MELVMQLAANGIVTGVRYGLVALGFALVLSVTGMMHFAHGAVFTVSGYVFYVLWRDLGVHWLPGILITSAVAALLATGTYLGVYRRVPRKNTHGVFVCALGLMIVLENLIHLVWGTEGLSLRAGGSGYYVQVAGIVVTEVGMATVVVGVLLLLLMVWFLRRTEMGRAMRAMADHPGMAAVVGIDVRRTALAAFAISAVLAVPPAILAGLDEGLVPHAGTEMILAAVAASVIGGIGSLPGAVLGGLLIGLLQNLAAGWLPTSWMNTLTFLGMFVFIVFYPRGLFGQKTPQVEV